MDIYLLGNGFDLHYGFPTQYSNFLNTVNFIYTHKNQGYDSVGKVFEHTDLQQIDNKINTAYEKYKKAYNAVSLPIDVLPAFAKEAKDNIWFSYMEKRLNVNGGWIDFEKEITRVLGFVDKILLSARRFHHAYIISSEIEKDEETKDIIEHFGFFCKREPQYKETGLHKDAYVIHDEYLIEVFSGSTKRKINRTKIVDELFEKLMDLSSSLQMYLFWFVEKPLIEIANIPEIKMADWIDVSRSSVVKVITFNYTHTWECLISKAGMEDNAVVHIHGAIREDKNEENNQNHIVLGVNSDKQDELQDIDTTFIQFKKYYQRALFSTEESYYKLLSELNARKDSDKKCDLYVIGHSLDITDKDIIQELFNLSTSITIYFHKDTAKRSYIQNLIIIFGKKKYDKLRKDKGLQFKNIAVLEK